MHGVKDVCRQVGKMCYLKQWLKQLHYIYIVSVFRIPVSIHESLEGCIRKSRWNELCGGQHMHWIAWVTNSKGEGGIGFHDLRIFNQALLGRQAWRLLERPESLMCTRDERAKYYPNGKLLDNSRSIRLLHGRLLYMGLAMSGE
jgi:hypothetical protein